MNLAPIIVFAFNRLDTLKNTINSLLQNEEAKLSDLFVFVDGPRENKQGEKEKVKAVQEYVKNIIGFKSLHYNFSSKNKGLANSIINGTTEIINQYYKVIVIEDDLYVSTSFLHFMNQMLNLYEHDKRIMQISGYGSLLKNINRRRHAFCKRGSDLYGMLKKCIEGKNNSWYIRFNYAMFKQKRYAICPIRSLVRNDGFIAESTHCNTYNRYKIDFEEYHYGNFNVPNQLDTDEKIMSEAVKYWSIKYRIYGKIRTFLMRIMKV